MSAQRTIILRRTAGINAENGGIIAFFITVYFRAIVFTMLSAVLSSGVSGEWRLPPNRSNADVSSCSSASGVADATACLVIAQGDSNALVAALGDDKVEQIWLSGSVVVPPQNATIHIRRHLLLGGLQPFTALTFEIGEGVKGLLRVYGFLALYRLRLYGFLEFMGTGSSSTYHSDTYKVSNHITLSTYSRRILACSC